MYILLEKAPGAIWSKQISIFTQTGFNAIIIDLSIVFRCEDCIVLTGRDVKSVRLFISYKDKTRQ